MSPGCSLIHATCDFSFETDEFQDLSTTRCHEEWNERRALEIFPRLCRSIISLRPEPRRRGNAEVVRIGYQKYGSFNVVKARHTFDDQLAARGIKIGWILFPAGPQLLKAMNADAIDLGHTGEAPPIFAQAANNPFIYVGNQRPDPSGEAILVAENSPIKTVADLKEKRSL